jgi:hypothetical protein
MKAGPIPTFGLIQDGHRYVVAPERDTEVEKRSRLGDERPDGGVVDAERLRRDRTARA